MDEKIIKHLTLTNFVHRESNSPMLMHPTRAAFMTGRYPARTQAIFERLKKKYQQCEKTVLKPIPLEI
jgi:hypothetical protein